ncbi:MAG: hypothetical protein EBT15_06280 [Betaproteobacteria bacterium]|nr:hypothetical protein [Betaproteobacteria bacterium]
MKFILLLTLFALGSAVHAQAVPAHTEGLSEELVSVTLDGSKVQQGVLSIRKGTSRHTRLAVLLPGYPSVVRPVVSEGVMQSSKLSGNFLIRSRRHLADDKIATLLVDCHSESGDYCSSSYQASANRQQDVQKLIDLVRKNHPSIEQVWLIGTSMGTISSSFMPIYGPSDYAGAIHTASITEPYAPRSYRELADFDYRRSGVPQFLVHHVDDPCSLTTFSGAKRISEKFAAPLIAVFGGTGFTGDACNALTQHGFRGMEQATMAAIGSIVKSGKVAQLEVR